MTFKKVFKTELYENYEREFTGTINEAGLARVLSTLESGQDFVIITAFRGDNSTKENISRNNELIKTFRSSLKKEIGAYKLVGHWKECSEPLGDDENISKCKGKVTDTLEESWLITRPSDISRNDFTATALKLAKKYDQDAIVIRLENKLTLRGKDGSVWADLGKANKKSIAQGLNRLINVQGYPELKKDRTHGKARSIIFEDIYLSVPKDTNSSKQLFKRAGILYT